jgi:hypothetical protein
MISIRPRKLATIALAAALVATSAAMAAAQGTISGTVTAAVGGAPLQDTRVTVVGTSIVTNTGVDGKYVLRRVPVGTAEVRVIRVGFAEQKKSVAVTEGSTMTVDCGLQAH